MAKTKTVSKNRITGLVEGLKISPVERRLVTVRLIGISPLVQHAWNEKAKQMMRDKQQLGKKTKNRDLRNPEEEGKAAGYYTKDGEPAVIVEAIKAAVLGAAHKDLGIEKTLVRKALFILPEGHRAVVPLETVSGKGKVKQAIEEDMVRVGAGSADLRYRPYYYDWAVTTQWEIDSGLLQVRDLLTLLDRAGFGVGICEMRPEKGGSCGRWVIDEKFDVKDEPFTSANGSR